MSKKVAYQGTKASFSEMAIERFFGASVVSVGKVAFDDVFASLDSKEVDLAALPVENSLIGPIVENFDLLACHDVSVIGELCLPIEHCLVGKKGQRMEEIKKVYSHPKALAQCTRFFQEHPWMEPVVHFDTAGAAREVSLQNKNDTAAIGSRKTADVYGLELLKANLEDDRSNTTRFLFLGKGTKSNLLMREGKCSLLFTLQHTPGALLAALSVLAEQGLNLTQIASRPIKNKPFEYLFFVDILFSRSVDMEQVLNALKKKTQTLKLLGLYEPAK
ncbi:MAG: prephenate dehydratase [Verrucomicrobia bacterium]|nr:prephenate dehydratase [Verrucomicrobiota bacterium]